MGAKHQAAGGQAGAHGVGGRRGERVGDHRVGRAVGGRHRGQGVGELEDGAAAGPFGTGSESPWLGASKGPRGSRPRPAGRRRRPAASATRPSRGPGRRPAGRPGRARRRRVVRPRPRRRPCGRGGRPGTGGRGRLPVVAAVPVGDGEPERLRPAGPAAGATRSSRANDRTIVLFLIAARRLEGISGCLSRRDGTRRGGRPHQRLEGAGGAGGASGSSSSRLAWW